MGRRAFSAVAATVVLAVPASAAAQGTGTYVGSALGPGAGTRSVADHAKQAALTLVRAGAEMRVRVVFFTFCGDGKPVNGDDLLLRVPIDVDGNMRGHRTVHSDELGTAIVSVSGTLTATGGSGLVRVNSRGRTKCDTTPMPFTAAAVDPSASPDVSGAPTPGATLVGVTDQPASVPYPFVARVSADGRRLERCLTVVVAKRSARTRGRTYHDPIDVETDIQAKIAAGRATQQTVERKRFSNGHTAGSSQRFDAGIGAGGLSGTLGVTTYLRKPGYSDHAAVRGVGVRAFVLPG